MSISRIPSNLLVSRMATDLVRKQNDLAEVQEQISSGKRINRPSDGPAHSAHIISMDQTADRLEQYNRNASLAESQLTLEENALAGTVNSLMRVRELALSANNGVADDLTRQAINAEVKLRLDELYSLANTADSFGNYLFAGSNSQNIPFTPGDPVNYAGSDDSHLVTIGPGRTIPTGDSGADTFLRIRNGNGDFTVKADPANLGTGTIEFGSVTDKSIYSAQPYEIRFSSASSFDIVEVNTGATLQSGVNYEGERSIEFQGIKTSIGGSPAAGDTFLIEPSRNQDVFSTVSQFVNVLNQSPQTDSDRAKMSQDIKEVLTNIDQAIDHSNRLRAGVGARLNNLESSRDENDGMKLQIETIRSEVEDIDVAEAVTNLQLKANSLEILQQSFVRIEGLSLFNHM